LRAEVSARFGVGVFSRYFLGVRKWSDASMPLKELAAKTAKPKERAYTLADSE
jgi:hypothetical protein